MGPADLSQRLFEFLEAGDLDRAVDLYEPDAVFIDQDRRYAGREAIRGAHERFLGEGIRVHLHESAVFEAGDLALVHWSWTATDGDSWSIDGTSAEVLRRQPDGTWKFIIDNSDGPAVIGLH